MSTRSRRSIGATVNNTATRECGERKETTIVTIEVDEELNPAASPSSSCAPPPAAASSSSSPSPSPAPAPLVSDADSIVDSSSGETKYARLHHLLDQTSLFSKFLAERMPERFNEKQKSVKKESSSQRATHMAERTKELKSIITQDGGVDLHPFQIAGVDWLISLYENGLNGILADEMGLGKTVQLIVFLAFLRRRKVFGPFLIVGPLGTLPSWISEIQRWTSCETPVIMYHGDKTQRTKLRQRFMNPTNIDEKYPIIVTSYEIAMIDSNFLRRIHWKLLCVDEGHRLKNIESTLIQKLKQFPSENRLLLTGTPLQNSLPELWSLLHFLLPDVFASLSQFQSWFDFDPSTFDDREGQQHIINAERDHLLVTKLHSILRPFVLRRIKADVLPNLMEKKEYTLYVPMTPLQRLYYLSILDGSMRSIVSSSTQQRRTHINLRNVLMQLRKVCNHPYLLLSDDEEAKLGTDLELRAHHMPHALSMASCMPQESKNNNDDAILDLADLMEDIPIAKLHAHLNKRSKLAVREEEEEELLGPMSEEEGDGEDEEDGEFKAPTAAASRRRRSHTDATSEDAQQPEFETITARNKRRKLAASLAPLREAAAASSADSTSHADSDLSFADDPHRLIRVCGKLLLLQSLLPALRSRGSRVLIFSQMTSVLDVLEDFLETIGAGSEFQYCRIDGSTSAKERARQMEVFNKDESYFIFLLSTRAGGLGLNLAAADTVILYDTDWNPHCVRQHNDSQAADRAHRLTSTRPVIVFRLLTPGSVEVGMLERATSKKKLEQLVLTKGRFHQKQRRNGGNTKAAAASSSADGDNVDGDADDDYRPNDWRHQQGIVSELIDLFKMQPTAHAAVKLQINDRPTTMPTHGDASASASSSSATPVSSSSSAPSRSNRRAGHKRKSTPPSSSASASPPPSTLPSTTPFDPAWIDRLLLRSEPPPEDVLPQSSYDAGYAYVTPVVDKAGLLHMLTEHEQATDTQ